MKTKTIKLHIVNLFCLVFCLNAWAQQPRNVIWLHGLGDNASTWQHYEQIFTAERQINSLRESYTSSLGIDHATTSALDTIDNLLGSGAFHQRNLAIGHSMGGVVARNIDRIALNHQKRFGGIITVASPNYGAGIANSLIDGSVTNAAANAVSRLSAGPYAQLFPFSWIAGGIIYQTFTFSPSNIGNLFVNNPQIQNFLSSSTSASDLRVGSQKLLEINGYSSTIPRISLWAEERSPVHWRILGSYLNHSLNLPPNEQPFVNHMNDARNVYNAFYLTNLAFAYSTLIMGIITLKPGYLANSTFFGYCAIEWRKGRNWFDSSESIWSTLIKTSRVETYYYYVCGYVCDDNGWVWPEVKAKNFSNCQWTCWLEQTSVVVNYPSDGLLPEYTQKLQGIPPGNVYRILNANHKSLLNLSYKGTEGDNTRKEFDKIWNRTPDSDFFRTPPRPL